MDISSSSVHQLCQGESVRSPVLSVICFITRHSSFSSRSKVRSPGGKRHLGSVGQENHKAMVKRGTETCWNPLKPNPARDEIVIFDDFWIWCNNSKEFLMTLFLYCEVSASYSNYHIHAVTRVTGDCINLLPGSAKAHDDDSSHWMALHSGCLCLKRCVKQKCFQCHCLHCTLCKYCI